VNTLTKEWTDHTKRDSMPRESWKWVGDQSGDLRKNSEKDHGVAAVGAGRRGEPFGGDVKGAARPEDGDWVHGDADRAEQDAEGNARAVKLEENDINYVPFRCMRNLRMQAAGWPPLVGSAAVHNF